MKNFKELLNHITCFVFDIDGVLTNGQLMITNEGQLLRSMNIKDGYAMQLAIKQGYKIWIISGAHNDGVVVRLKNLGITDVYTNVKNKSDLLEELSVKNNVAHSGILFMGDDMPDIEAMKKCGIACCPKDAVHQVKSISIYTSEQTGGNGCVRDVIEQVLTLQDKWL